MTRVTFAQKPRMFSAINAAFKMVNPDAAQKSWVDPGTELIWSRTKTFRRRLVVDESARFDRRSWSAVASFAGRSRSNSLLLANPFVASLGINLQLAAIEQQHLGERPVSADWCSLCRTRRLAVSSVCPTEE
jgi:hypothetical protein